MPRTRLLSSCRSAIAALSLLCLAGSQALAQAPRLLMDPVLSDFVQVNEIVTVNVNLFGGANGLTGVRFFSPVITILNRNNLEFVQQTSNPNTWFILNPNLSFTRTVEDVQVNEQAQQPAYDINTFPGVRLFAAFETPANSTLSVGANQTVTLGSFQVKLLQPSTTDIVLLTSSTSQDPGSVNIGTDSLVAGPNDPFTPTVTAFGKATVTSTPGPEAWMILGGGQGALLFALRRRKKA